MKHSMSFLHLVVVVLISGAIASAAPLHDLCSNLGSSYVTYDFCMTRLGADPRSSAAKDVPSLAAISLDLCVRNATRVRSRVVSMLTDDKYASVRKHLNVCLTLYSNVIPALRWSAGAIATRRYEVASDAVTDAAGVPSSCDGVFDLGSGGGGGGVNGGVSPLSKENAGFSGLAILAEAITRVLHH